MLSETHYIAYNLALGWNGNESVVICCYSKLSFMSSNVEDHQRAKPMSARVDV